MAARNWEVPWATIGDFLSAGAGTRFGARVYELRQEGYQIEEKYFGKKGLGDHRYFLKQTPQEAQKAQQQKAQEVAKVAEITALPLFEANRPLDNMVTHDYPYQEAKP